MRNLILSLAFMLVGSFAFANSHSVKKQNNIIIENYANKLKVVYDLGDLTNLSETELINLLDNLPAQILDSEKFDECSISYTLTISILGQSVAVTASGTASTCEEAGRIARAGIRSESLKAEAMVKELLP